MRTIDTLALLARARAISGDASLALSEAKLAEEKTLALPDQARRERMVHVLQALAYSHRGLGDHAAASASADEAIQLGEAVFGCENIFFADTLEVAAEMRRVLKDSTGEAQQLKRALRIYEANFGSNHRTVVRLRATLSGRLAPTCWHGLRIALYQWSTQPICFPVFLLVPAQRSGIST